MVPHLRLLLARSQVALGREDAAGAQLESGIREMESMRVLQADGRSQVSFFERGASLFDDMVALQLDKRHDPKRALSFVERGRARQLADALQPPVSRKPSSDPLPAASALEPDEVQRELPHGLALVYCTALSDRLVSWVVTREASRFFDQRLSREELRRRWLRPTRQRWRRGPRSRSCVSRRPGCLTIVTPAVASARRARALVFRTESCSPFRSLACGTDRPDAIWSKTTSSPSPRAEPSSFALRRLLRQRTGSRALSRGRKSPARS